LTSYYEYRRQYEQAGGQVQVLAGMLRRKTSEQTQMSRAQLPDRGYVASALVWEKASGSGSTWEDGVVKEQESCFQKERFSW
jgi:hypothetical protein